ncbi:hypothetical protein C8J56DRAFT_910997 [Mycena floridula]|nr:hypothetical protein C8J56DRAFT_910997 [Mycena floridula]
MSTFSRAESQPPDRQYGRRRSNTAHSILRPPALPSPPVQVGESKIFNSWVHDDIKESPNVIFNHSWWPGIAEGDMLSVTGTNSDAFFFIAPKDDGCAKPQLQISIPKPVADAFSLRNNGEVAVTKVDKEQYCADYVEFVFQDQYLGRNDMWRLGEHLAGRCIYVDQEVSFIGSIMAKIQAIYIDGKKVPAAYMTSRTKSIYRSLSAKVTIFIQVCRELWDFAGDGERYNEKIVHSFLPALFTKWKEAGTNHTVTIVLISRVYYDQSEIDYAAGPLRCDERGNWYKDFYKVITDLEVKYEWESTLVSLKNSFWDFQRDILLTHHYHRASLEHPAVGPAEQVRLVGRLSYAHDGPILEALNIGLNPTETHYIDRSLSSTGASTIVISPGTGYYRVSKQLLRLTTTRMLDQGFGLDLICLTKPPLHQSPIFSFQGFEPEAKDGMHGPRAMDPLWGGDEDGEGGKTRTFWWEPFWISVSFWDTQMDLPFRADRFIARAKMHEIQMLGLLEHDVLSSIEVPYLPEDRDQSATPPQDESHTPEPSALLTKADADKFDLDIFSLTPASSKPSSARNSLQFSAGQSASFRVERRYSHRNSLLTPQIQAIQESPRVVQPELPPEKPEVSQSPAPFGRLSSSPSQSSIHSNLSTSSSKINSTRPTHESGSRSTLASKLAPSWLFRPFRSDPSEPQTSPVSASASSSTSSAPIRVVTAPHPTLSPSPIPLAIKGSPSAARSSLSRMFEDELTPAPRSSFARRSPLNTPPREETSFGKRRSVIGTFTAPFSSSSPNFRSNPSQIQTVVTSSQSSLAARWQHTFPEPQYKYDIKWKSIVTPGCLPLTVEFFPSQLELETNYDMFSYDFVVDPGEMRSFLVKPPTVKGNADEVRRAWALVVMRGMVAVRLAQGFQFVLHPQKSPEDETKAFPHRFDDLIPKPAGASEVLQSTTDPVYLSMSNEIHRISYTGDMIQVTRYVRRMTQLQPVKYQCLIWPKLGVGYTEQSTTFKSHGLENYGWNRLDMLVAGYEHQFNESLRYWRTRFVVIPTTEPPATNIGPTGEKLNDEEIRILGIERLAEQFSKLRWQPPDERATAPAPPVRFLPTTLNPAAAVRDETLINQLDQIHASGPLRKNFKSDREIEGTPLGQIAKAMREENGVPIKHYHWHRSQYPDSFTGFDFVSWLVREFRDVSSRAQGTEWGIRLLDQGLLEHCKGSHNFLDGHYFYRLKGEYAVPSTPRGWFNRSRHVSNDETTNRSGFYPGSIAKPKNEFDRLRRLILSQTMVIDIDPAKKSDQAESVILHHDIMHNPGTVLHFELQWIGTTARFIEDQLRHWNRTIERYGLKLVETYVTQISDIRERNAFQSCFPMRLAVPPPIVADIHKQVPEGTPTSRYFEYALLRRFGFIIDVEAAELYPANVEVFYSYRRSPFRYSQFVHRSGVAFIQVLGGSKGFLFLTNRLIGPGRMGTTMKNKDSLPATAAQEIRLSLQKFCSSEAELNKFYDQELALLHRIPEEPPPLRI